MPPQYYILYTLSHMLQGNRNTPEQRHQIQSLSRASFGRMVLNPRRFGQPDSEGRVTITYEGDEVRGGPRGRLHRVVVKINKAGVGAITCLLFLRY